MEGPILQYFSTHQYDERLTVLLYLVDPNADEALDFPINKLRNLGIRSTHTTHYMVIDMDVWPARNLAESVVT